MGIVAALTKVVQQQQETDQQQHTAILELSAEVHSYKSRLLGFESSSLNSKSDKRET